MGVKKVSFCLFKTTRLLAEFLHQYFSDDHIAECHHLFVLTLGAKLKLATCHKEHSVEHLLIFKCADKFL